MACRATGNGPLYGVMTLKSDRKCNLHSELLHFDGVDQRPGHGHQHRRIYQLSGHLHSHLSLTHTGDPECLSRPGLELQRLERRLQRHRPCNVTMTRT